MEYIEKKEGLRGNRALYYILAAALFFATWFVVVKYCGTNTKIYNSLGQEIQNERTH